MAFEYLEATDGQSVELADDEDRQHWQRRRCGSATAAAAAADDGGLGAAVAKTLSEQQSEEPSWGAMEDWALDKALPEDAARLATIPGLLLRSHTAWWHNTRYWTRPVTRGEIGCA